MNIIEVSFSAGLLVCILLLVRLITFRFFPKRVYLALWCIVLIRLLCPLRIDIGSDFFRFWNVHEMIGIETEQYSVKQLRREKNPKQTEGQAEENRADRIVFLWVTVAMVIGGKNVWMYLRGSLQLREALPLSNQEAMQPYIDQFYLRRHVRVYEYDRLTSPMTCGILRPRIIIPKQLELKSERQLECMIVHEMVHIRRFDTVRKMLAVTACSLHWFNPLVWIMCDFFHRDIEASCDEEVMSFFREDIREIYALSIIQMAKGRKQFHPAFSFFSKKAVHERIEGVMRYHKTSWFQRMCACAAFFTAMTVFGASSASGGQVSLMNQMSLQLPVLTKLANEISPQSEEIRFMETDEYSTQYKYSLSDLGTDSQPTKADKD